MNIEIGPLPFASEDGRHSDAGQAALASMTQAMTHLDSDLTIPPVIGAHLQLAIDSLRAAMGILAGPEE